MPDRVDCWIDHPHGIRRIQYQELAKAKGMTDDFEISTNQGGLDSIRNGTCVHLRTAVLDHLSKWNRGELKAIEEHELPVEPS
jgi:hypothetical protein